MMNRRRGAEGSTALWEGSDDVLDREAVIEEEELNERYRYKDTVAKDYELALNRGRRYRHASNSPSSNRGSPYLGSGQWLAVWVTLIMCVSMFVVGLRFQAKNHSYAFPWNDGVQSEAKVNWEEYLKKLDPLWSWVHSSDAPSTYGNSPFMGNGNLGLTIRVDNDETNKIRLDIGRSDVYVGSKRFPVGCFWVDLSGVTKTRYGTLRTHLWNAVTDGSIGHLSPVSMASFVHATEDVIVVSLNVPTSFDQEKLITFKPGYYGNPNPPKERPAKPPVCTKEGSISTCMQTLSGPLESFSVAWTMSSSSDPTAPNKKIVRVYATVSPIVQLSKSKAMTTLTKAREHTYDELLASHVAWWHSYYPSSFITLDNIT